MVCSCADHNPVAAPLHDPVLNTLCDLLTQRSCDNTPYA
jgi:hypothetical protein